MEEVIVLHAHVWEDSNETPEPHLLNLDRLESALARPRFSAYYEQSDVVHQAVTLLWGLVKAHAFIDGNKRVAWLATRSFLLANSIEPHASIGQTFDLVVGIAENRHDLDYVDDWMRQHVRPHAIE